MSKPPGRLLNKSLADRLTEIKEALDSGLLTQSEYEAKRNEILKEY